MKQRNCIAFFRGVNVGGKNLIAAAELKNLFAALGFLEIRPILQSGNVVFKAQGMTAEAIEKEIECAAENQLGIKTAVFVREPGELASVIDHNPFLEFAVNDPSHLLVILLKKAPSQKSIIQLRSSIPGRERVQEGDRHLYVVYPDGIGKSKFSNTMIEKCLGFPGTARNWNTLLKIQAATLAE
jgi:uncharacterized protein (DUF1697 family)